MNKRWMEWAVKKYLPDILTGMAMAGVPVTAWISAEAGKNSVTTAKEESWKNYIPPAISSALTMGCIFGSHKAHLHKEAVLTAVAALWSGKYRDLDRRAKELLGEERYGELRRLITRDGMERAGVGAPPWEEDELITYYEPYSQQYFKASPQAMLYAQLYINKVFQEYGGVKLNDYLNVLPGCHRVDIGSDIGWFQGTDQWEDIWGFYDNEVGHFIDIAFDELPNTNGVKLICYNVPPSLPDEDFEPWK